MKSILRNVFHLPATLSTCFVMLACVSTAALAADYNWRADGTASTFTDGSSWSPASPGWVAGDTANFLSGTNRVTGDVFLKGTTNMNGVHLIAQSGSLTTATGAMELRRGDTRFSVLSGAEFTIGGSMYVDGGILLDGGTLTQTTGEFRVCHDANVTTTYTGVVELKNGATLNAFNLRLNQTDGKVEEVKLIIADSTANLSGTEFLVGGNKSKATVTQSGNSTVNISGATNFKIASTAAAVGSAYYLQGGVLNYATDTATGGVFSMSEGNTTGLFIHTGGTFNFGSAANTRDLWIRHGVNQTDDRSHYAISGASSVLNLHGNLLVSNGALFSIADGAKVDVNGNVRVGTAGNWISDFTMTGGSLNINGGTFIVGDSSGGRFNQSGDSVVTVSENTNFYIGNSAVATGSSYTISGGTLNINAKDFVIGNTTGNAASNTGLFYQSGNSTVNISGATNFKIGADDAARDSTYYLQDGTLNYGTDNKTGGAFLMSETGSTRGFFRHTGGTFNFGTADAARNMWLQNSVGAGNGNHYNISGSSSVLNLYGNLQASGGAWFLLTDGAKIHVNADKNGDYGEVQMGIRGSYLVSCSMDGEDSLLETGSFRLGRNTSFTQTNGDVIIHNNLHVGEAFADSTGNGNATYTMHDGSITFDGAAGNFVIGTSNFIAGYSSIFTMNDGEILFQGSQFMMGAETAAKTGTNGSTFNLNGGTFTYQGSGDVLLGVEANRNVKFNHAAGTFDAQDNTIKLNSGATYTLNGAGAELKAAKVDTTGGGTFTFTNGTAEIDTFFGDLNQQGGTLRGITNIDGDYTQAAGATLDLVLANPGDLLSISGEASLGGLMNIILSGDFIAHMGADPVTIIDADSFMSFSENFSVFATGNYTVGWDMSAGLVTLQQDGSHATPEPATWAMLLAALAILGVMRRRGKAVIK